MRNVSATKIATTRFIIIQYKDLFH